MICDHCLFYVAGLLVSFAYDDISYHKVATQSSTYIGQQYEAKNAVDRNKISCTRTDSIGRSSPDKTVWWKVDLGGVYNIYSITILFKNYDGFTFERQRGRFAGFSMYVSDFNVLSSVDIKGSTLCYKDGPEFPSLNFTTVCTENGRYVIYYNERLEGVIYPEGYEVENIFTELCEVIVQGCNNASFYGSNCDSACPTNCKDSTCQIQNGTCFSCKPGWTGLDCDTKCREGLHGINCSQQCVGRCRDGVTCNHLTGNCDGGCDAGWTGVLCNKECADGRYGYNCVNNCSGYCLNDSPCNKQTGQCDKGCSPGYTTDNCSKVCPSGHYGKNCREMCSRHCINNEQCDHVSGVCMSGCQDGFVGTHCNDSCTIGYFGTNCSKKCSPNCKPDTCRHTDGSCTTCVVGYAGYNCTTECILSYGENCQYQCNVQCINQTCDRINGSCLYGCTEGERCDKDVENYAISSSNNLPVTVGILVFACVLIIIGVVTICVIRQKSPSTMSDTGVHRVCWRSSPAAEESVKSEDLSNYQELNFSLQENPYQSMSR